MRTRIIFRTAVVITLVCASLSYGHEVGVPAAPGTAIDETLYTKYSLLDRGHTSVGWSVCGSLPSSSGCYGSGSLGPVGKIGALLEGDPQTDLIANTVTRPIYVLDIASGPNQNEVVLYVYTKVDTITTDSDTVTATLSQTITLPLVGGLLARPSMGANQQFLFIGIDQSPYAVEIDKNTFSVTQLGGFSPPINGSGITADQYGYVTLSFGAWKSAKTGIIVCDSNGNVLEQDSGQQFMLNTVAFGIRGFNPRGFAAELATDGTVDGPFNHEVDQVATSRSAAHNFSIYRNDSTRASLSYGKKGGAPAGTPPPIDATLYTKYSLPRGAHTSLDWSVCGSLPDS